MDEARQHFLAGAGLADDQHRAVARGDAPRELDRDAASSARKPPARPRRARALAVPRRACSMRRLSHSTSHARMCRRVGWRLQKACRAQTGGTKREGVTIGGSESAAASVNLPASPPSIPSLRSFSTSVVRRRLSRRAACATVPLGARAPARSSVARSTSRCARRSRPSSGSERAAHRRGGDGLRLRRRLDGDAAPARSSQLERLPRRRAHRAHRRLPRAHPAARLPLDSRIQSTGGPVLRRQVARLSTTRPAADDRQTLDEIARARARCRSTDTARERPRVRCESCTLAAPFGDVVAMKSRTSSGRSSTRVRSAGISMGNTLSR